MCCDHLAVVLLFTVVGAVSQQTGQVDFAVVPAWSCLQHTEEGSGMSFPSHLNPRVLKVFQNRHVRRFGPSHMCVLLSSSLMLYVYCFEFVLLANRLQNISRMSFPLLPSPPQTMQNMTGPAAIQADVLYLLCILSVGSTIFFCPFTLVVLLLRTNLFSLCSVSNC